MELLAIRMEDADLERLKARAAELRIPFTIYARSLIVTALNDKEDFVKTERQPQH